MKSDRDLALQARDEAFIEQMKRATVVFAGAFAERFDYQRDEVLEGRYRKAIALCTLTRLISLEMIDQQFPE